MRKKYNVKSLQKKTNIKLKSFFFLKIIKKQKNFYFTNTFKKSQISINLKKPFAYFFKFLFLFKKNLINFTGLPFFKNYNKALPVKKINFNKSFSKRKKKFKT